MKGTSYTFEIETENHLNIISRVLNIFSRRRINIQKIEGALNGEKQCYKITVHVEPGSAHLISSQLEKQVDILDVKFYEFDHPHPASNAACISIS